MTLREQLDALRVRRESGAPREVVDIMRRQTEELRRSGILAHVLGPGAAAPAFALPNTEGRVVTSQELLARGPLVLTFYRGKW